MRVPLQRYFAIFFVLFCFLSNWLGLASFGLVLFIFKLNYIYKWHLHKKTQVDEASRLSLITRRRVPA